MFAGFVAGRRHHTAPTEPANNNGNAHERVVAQPLHLDVEGIHVYMEKLLRNTGTGRRWHVANCRLVHVSTVARRRDTEQMGVASRAVTRTPDPQSPLPSPAAASRAHLVRHGEVHNPDHIVYADLPGYGLSTLGREQAAETARHLSAHDIRRVVSSPLQRAIETAGFIAAPHGIGVVIDDRLTEWRLAKLWAGVVWEDLETTRPGELEAYLDNPADLPFAPETLAEVGARVAAAAHDHASAVDGDIVIVSHQDPIHAGARTLTEVGFDDFDRDKPAHATVVTLRTDSTPWQGVARFDPEQGGSFPPPTPRRLT